MQAVALFSPQVTDPELVMCDNVTGVACSADGRHLLANYLNNHVYLFSIDGVGLGAAPALAASPPTPSGRARRDIAGQGAALLSLPLLQLDFTPARKPERQHHLSIFTVRPTLLFYYTHPFLARADQAQIVSHNITAVLRTISTPEHSDVMGCDDVCLCRGTSAASQRAARQHCRGWGGPGEVLREGAHPREALQARAGGEPLRAGRGPARPRRVWGAPHMLVAVLAESCRHAETVSSRAPHHLPSTR